MMCAADFRRIARESLKGKWGIALGTGLVASLLGGTIGSGGTSVSANSASVEQRISSGELENFFYSDAFRHLLPLIFIIGAIAVVWSLVILVLGGAVSLGYAKFNLNLVDGQPSRFDDLFSEFHRSWPAFCLQFLMGLFVFLWSLLFIIPGILAAFSYSMATYIMAENPDMTAREAIAASKEMMRGNRWRLFCLGFSFIGWSLLCVLTLGIGTLWLRPYEEAAPAAVYRDLSGTAQPAAPELGEYRFDPSGDYQPPQ